MTSFLALRTIFRFMFEEFLNSFFICVLFSSTLVDFLSSLKLALLLLLDDELLVEGFLLFRNKLLLFVEGIFLLSLSKDDMVKLGFRWDVLDFLLLVFEFELFVLERETGSVRVALTN